MHTGIASANAAGPGVELLSRVIQCIGAVYHDVDRAAEALQYYNLFKNSPFSLSDTVS